MDAFPSIRTLEAFESAARHGSYSAAANELGLTHGAISHRIRELEERLNTKLFRREGRQMVPTREAITLLTQARQALSLLQRAFPARPKAGHEKLVISAHPAFAVRWLIRRISRFAQLFPNADIEIRSTADLNDFLDPGIDLAIRYGSGPWPNATDERLGGDVLFPVCTLEYRDRLPLNSLSDLPRANLLRHSWQPWSPWFRAAKINVPEPDSGMILSDSAMLIEAAAAGQGVALTLGRLVEQDIKSGRLIRPFELQISDTLSYYLVHRHGVKFGPIGVSFRDWMMAEFKMED